MEKFELHETTNSLDECEITPKVKTITMEYTPTYEQKQAVLELVRDWSEKGYDIVVKIIDKPNYGVAVNKLIDCGSDPVSAIEFLFEQAIELYDYDELDDYFTVNEQDDLWYCDDFVFNVWY